jgi:hypothetical protein
MRRLFAMLGVAGLIAAAEPHAQDFAFQLSGVDSLRELKSVTVQAAFVMYAEPAGSIGKKASVTKDSLQRQVESKFEGAAIPVTTSAPQNAVLSVRVGLICAPIEPVVCWADVAFRLSQTAKTPTGQEINAISWERVDGFMGPGDISEGIPLRVDQVADRFVNDWTSAHQK